MRKRTRAALVAVVTLLAGLVGAELWLRAYRPVEHRAPLDLAAVPHDAKMFHRRSDVPGLAYELVPGVQGEYSGVEVSINTLGQRGPEVLREKPEGTFRVVAIGDSLTFGYGAPQEGTWPAALQRELVRDASTLGVRSVEVLNLGVSGYNSADEACVLEAKALALAPDVIVVGYFLNDPQVAPLQTLPRWFGTPSLWERSHLLRLVDSWFFARAKARFGNDAYRYLHDPDAEGWAMVQTAFESMHRAASAHGVPVVIATLPAFPPGPNWNDYRWSELHARVMAAARERGLEAIDAVPEFQLDDRRPKDLGVDFEHPNPEGAEIIARAVAREVLRLAARARSDGPR